MKPHIRKNSELNAQIRRDRQWRVERATQTEQDDEDWSDYDEDYDEDYPRTRDEKLRHSLVTIDHQGLQIKDLETEVKTLKGRFAFCTGGVIALIIVMVFVLGAVLK